MFPQPPHTAPETFAYAANVERSQTHTHTHTQKTQRKNSNPAFKMCVAVAVAAVVATAPTCSFLCGTDSGTEILCPLGLVHWPICLRHTVSYIPSSIRFFGDANKSTMHAADIHTHTRRVPAASFSFAVHERWAASKQNQC